MKNFGIYQELYKDDRFYKEVFVDEVYKEVFNKKKDIVLDVGACAGEFSFWIKGKDVYAIEPQTEYFEEMVANIEEFGFHNVHPFNLAIAGKNGLYNLDIGVRGGSKLGGVNGQLIESKTLSTFMFENNIPYIDILKIDIEGGEDNVFSAEDFKDIASKINCIIGEHLAGISGFFEQFGFKSRAEKGNYIFEK